jgi:hypothetical protein
MREFNAVVDEVIPSIASDCIRDDEPSGSGSWSQDQALNTLLKRLQKEDHRTQLNHKYQPFSSAQNLRLANSDTWRNIWTLYATGVLLFITLTILLYRIGIRAGEHVANVIPLSAKLTADTINTQLTAALQGRIRDLAALLDARNKAIDDEEELLSHDRDIRELMGARDLYIAEVYDVGDNGATRKPYGRVFYTKGKSLIFYAYDLDQQTNIKNASSFQAWGMRGTDRQRALSLGIFYEDNDSKKRWVLKTSDSKLLEQVDEVFVTVEPNGGSHRPSTRPLLFAYLRIGANHP